VGTAERPVFRSLSHRKIDRVIDFGELGPIHSIEIIRLILGQIHEEVPRGVRVVLAHQGTYDFLRPRLSLSSTIFCQFADLCVDLDDALAADPAHLLPDGLWSVSGHATVAQIS
jgi:hypothetical protein